MVHGKLKHTKFDITPLYNLKIINLQKLRTDINTLQSNRNGIIPQSYLRSDPNAYLVVVLLQNKSR